MFLYTTNHGSPHGMPKKDSANRTHLKPKQFPFSSTCFSWQTSLSGWIAAPAPTLPVKDLRAILDPSPLLTHLSHQIRHQFQLILLKISPTFFYICLYQWRLPWFGTLLFLTLFTVATLFLVSLASSVILFTYLPHCYLSDLSKTYSGFTETSGKDLHNVI